MHRRTFLAYPVVAALLQGQEKYPPRITSWIHRNDWSKALQSIRDHHSMMTEVSPMWYDTKENGNIGFLPNFPAEDPELFEIIQKISAVFRPIITNVNNAGTQPDLAMKLLAHTETKNRFLEEILRVARHGLFNGIDLDIEGIQGANMVHLANFVDELAPRLHDEGKSLAVCIEVQRDPAVPESWARIGERADLIRYMVYSEHTERTEPGPMASLEWSLSYLRRILAVVPTEKLSYGIAIYGRLWGESNYSATWEALMSYAERRGIQIQRDPENNTPWYKNGNETIWFEDAESIRTKILLGRSLGIDAFSFWRLGGEDPAIWDMIREV